MSARFLSLVLFTTSSFVVASCDDAATTATQVVVGIDVDPGVLAQTTHLRVEIYGGASLDALTLQRTLNTTYGSGAPPTYVILAPQGADASRVFRVVASARDGSDVPVASAVLSSGYVPKKVLYASMRIEDACVPVSCADPSQTCTAGTCTSAWVDPSTLYVVPDPAHFLDGGVPRDGGSDSGAGDGGNPDSGNPDGGSGCGTVDFPDDSFTDANCDGIDGDVADLVFVATTGNDATGAGTMAAPYRTIAKGLDAARNAGKSGVAVSAGTYAERVVLIDGVSVYGGYDATNAWSRALSNVCTITQSPSDVRTDNGTSYVEGVYASNIHARTVVDAFAIRVGNAATAPSTPGTNLYGVRIVDSMATGAAGVQLRNLDVVTYTASAGATGQPGAAGEDAVAGGNAVGAVGGAPGVARCGGSVDLPATRGGRGGNGGDDATLGCNLAAMNPPQAGFPPDGYPGCSRPAAGVNVQCTDPVDATADGTHGYYTACGPVVSADSGASAAPIATASRVDSTSGVHLVVSSGNMGSRGPHGVGGPGGGGGGAHDLSGSSYGLAGGGGGGGMSGSCGGYPGNPGQGGGASIALLVIRSSGVNVTSCHFTAGQAGNGGPGGTGGVGGVQPGNLGHGAVGPSGSTGGEGGSGRLGGLGAHGGGGAGGPSVAQLVCSSTVSGASSSSGTPGAAGTGGAGARFSAQDPAPGPNGPNGTSSSYVTNCSL